MPVFERLAAWVFGLAFVVLALLVAVETIMRRVFVRSLQGVDEFGGYALAIGAALAIALALRSRAHIRIDVVHDRLPRALRVALNLIAYPALALTAMAVFVMAWFAFRETIEFGSVAQTPWATPLKYPQGAWLAALAVFVIFALVEALKVIGLALSGRFREIDRHYGPRGAQDELEEELADLKARGGLAEPPGGGAAR
ncbi:MAG: TRAP transporter small permease [Beijerinckiaceae bacterium]|nr:TRAP transporter small permease [Beijerinckiaceae bacterium]MCZ8298755.1 TRAP transporter small permease [Beijerinckiaceae bacterium]